MMHIPKISNDMSQHLTALRQQLLQATEIEEVTAVLLPRMIETLLTPPPEVPVWRGPDPITMTTGPQIMESLLLHKKASGKFLEILRQEKPSPSSNLTAALLRAAAAILVGSEITISRIWLDMLLEAIEVVPADTVRSEVIPIAVRQSQAWNNTWARISACHLFGKVCLRLDPQELQSDVVPLLVALCQDVAWEVRSAACDQLVHAASCFRASPLLLSTLCELGADESEAVLVSVVGATASSLQKMTADTLVSAVTPLVMRLAREAAREGSPVLIALAAHYGDFCHGLRGFLSPEEKNWLVDMFQNMVRMGLPTINDTVFARFTNMLATDENMVRWSQQIRTLAASSLPSVSHFLLSEDRRDVLLGIVRDLVFDPHPPVRSSLASGLHQLVVALGANNSWLLKYDFIRLLSDQNIDVIKALIPSVTSIILLMKEGGIFSPEDTSVEKLTPCAEILQGLMACESTVVATLDWRLYADVIRQYEILPQCFPSDFIYNYVVSVMLQRIMTVRQLPSRCALSRIVLILLRFNARPEQRDDIRNKLAENLMRNKNSYHRMCYLRLSRIAVDIFSSHYFKEWFFKNIIILSEDRVATIRQVSADLFPSMKKMCKIPEDKNLVDMLDSAVSRLIEDSDKEVSNVAKSVHHKIKEIQAMDNTEEEADLRDEQRLEEERVVEQRVPPDNFLHHGTSFNLEKSTVTTESRTVSLQPMLNMTVSSQPINMASNVWRKPQTSTSPLLMSVHSQQMAIVNQEQSGSVRSRQDFQGHDFVIDAGIPPPPPERQSSHIPSPRRMHNQRGRHQNRRSWSGASNSQNRLQTQADYELADSANRQFVSDVSSLDTRQTDTNKDNGLQGAVDMLHASDSQAHSLLKNMKTASIGKGTGEMACSVKNKLMPSRDNSGKPATVNASIPANQVVMRPGRGRGGREISHRNSVSSIPFRAPPEYPQKSRLKESDESKASAVRRRNVHGLGGKTPGDSEGTRLLKRNSAIEFRVESPRCKDYFHGRRSATFERLADFNSCKSFIRPQRSSLGITNSGKEKAERPSNLPTSSNCEVKEKSLLKTDITAGSGNIALFDTKDNVVKEKVTNIKSDNNKTQIRDKTTRNVLTNRRRSCFEDNISPEVNDPTAEITKANQPQEKEKGESNKTAITVMCSKETGSWSENHEKKVDVELLQSNNVSLKEELKNLRQVISVTASHVTSADNVDKQNPTNEEETRNYSQVETNDLQTPLGHESCAVSNIKSAEGLKETKLDIVGKIQQHSGMAEVTLSNTDTSDVGELKKDQKLHFNHKVKNTKTTNDSINVNCMYPEKIDGTTKQNSRKSCNLEHYVTPRSSQQETFLPVKEFSANDRQHSSAVVQSERRSASNRHSVGAVLTAPRPPRRHSSLDRLGGPRTDLGDDVSGTARVSSCHSSPTAGLSASRLPVLRRQHPP